MMKHDKALPALIGIGLAIALGAFVVARSGWPSEARGKRNPESSTPTGERSLSLTPSAVMGRVVSNRAPHGREVGRTLPIAEASEPAGSSDEDDRPLSFEEKMDAQAEENEADITSLISDVKREELDRTWARDKESLVRSALATVEGVSVGDIHCASKRCSVESTGESRKATVEAVQQLQLLPGFSRGRIRKISKDGQTLVRAVLARDGYLVSGAEDLQAEPSAGG